MEDASLEDLRGAAAWLHDLYPDGSVRGRSDGRRLAEAAVEAARRLGSDSLMLAVFPRNERARWSFESIGLRPTMIETRIELDDRPAYENPAKLSTCGVRARFTYAWAHRRRTEHRKEVPCRKLRHS
jgi:hypothetical protein